MSSFTRTTIPQSSLPIFPINLFLRGEFKSYVNKLVGRSEIAQKFRPRLYSYYDFILVKLFALASKKSIDYASDYLNKLLSKHYRKKFNLKLKTFRDGIRKRRLVPHQTDVDKFFRRLSENDVHFIFGNLLNHVNQKIRSHSIGGSKMRLLVDNTEYSYYGKLRPPFEVGTHKQPGTRKARLFQGMAIQGCGMTLFSEFRLLRYKQYRAKHIGLSAKWHKFQGFNLSYALMDREFYRASLIKELKDQKLPVLIPAKKFQKVKKHFEEFLHGKRGLCEKYLFAQTPKTKPWPNSVHVHLVLTAHRSKSALQVREQFRRKKLTFDKAVEEIEGFFTTLDPRKNLARWSRWLSRTYKKRWFEETGFRMLNSIHESFRNHHPFPQLAQIYLRSYIFNCWQFYRKQQIKCHTKLWKTSLNVYQSSLTDVIEREMLESTKENV
ncbi:MAG: hypothetical protein K9W44_15040 [Candidatus Lokiarchaeota archaeon]|nr:hypothetical protein [Candidatus Harpocratesius repetitus]